MSKLTVALVLLSFAATCLADTGLEENLPATEADSKIENWYLYTSVFTRHYGPEPYHDNHQRMLAIEAQQKNNWISGFASFDNSFGQRSEYLYIGKKWPVFHSELWYVKLTGGLLYGYKEPYEDKIPFNGMGIAPAAFPTLGFQFRSFVSEVSFGGLDALFITTGITF